MEDRSFARLLAELDAELDRTIDTGAAGDDLLNCIEARAPGAVLRSASRIPLRGLGYATAGAR